MKETQQKNAVDISILVRSTARTIPLRGMRKMLYMVERWLSGTILDCDERCDGKKEFINGVYSDSTCLRRSIFPQLTLRVPIAGKYIPTHPSKTRKPNMMSV